MNDCVLTCLAWYGPFLLHGRCLFYGEIAADENPTSPGMVF